MTAVYKRELRTCFGSLHTWLFIAGCLAAAGAFFDYHNLLLGSTDVCSALCMPMYLPISFGKGYLYVPQLTFWLTLLFPVAGAFSMAPDRQDGTDLFLRALPVKAGAVAGGKYLALLTVYAVPTAVLCLIPLLFSAFGDVDMASAYAGIFLIFLLGAAALAVCLFISSLTKKVLWAYLIGVGALWLLYLPMTLQWPGVMTSKVCLTVLEWFFSVPLASCLSLMVCALLIGLIVWALTRSLPAGAVTAAVLTVVCMVLFLAAPGFMTGLVPNMMIMSSPFAQVETMVSYSELTVSGIAALLSYVCFFLFLTVRSVDSRRFL